MNVDSEALARLIAGVADDRKARDIVVLDMRELVAYTDFLIVCTVGSDRQAKAVIDAVRERVKAEHALVPGRMEGERGGRWTVVDYLDCVLHVFSAEGREFYRLENLWREAPRLELPLGAAAGGAGAA